MEDKVIIEVEIIHRYGDGHLGKSEPRRVVTLEQAREAYQKYAEVLFYISGKRVSVWSEQGRIFR